MLTVQVPPQTYPSPPLNGREHEEAAATNLPSLQLPREILLHILSFFSASFLAGGPIRLVNRTFLGLADDDVVWRELCVREHIEEPSSPSDIAWKKWYWDHEYKWHFDPEYCSSRLELSNGNMTVTHKSRIGNGVVMGSKGFAKGRHYFEVRIDKCAATHNNLLIGVCTRSIALDVYLGRSPCGFGYYMCCGSLYQSRMSEDHVLTMQHSPFFEKYGEGDTIGVCIDMHERTVSFFKNGRSLGVAFTQIPRVVYPAVSLLKQGDSVTVFPKRTTTTTTTAELETVSTTTKHSADEVQESNYNNSSAHRV